MLYIFQLFHLTPLSQILRCFSRGTVNWTKDGIPSPPRVSWYIFMLVHLKGKKGITRACVIVWVFVSPEEIINTRRRARI